MTESVCEGVAVAEPDSVDERVPLALDDCVCVGLAAEEGVAEGDDVPR